MTDDPKNREDDDLEAFFAAARADTPPLDIRLVNAVLADAAEQTALRIPRTDTSRTRESRFSVRTVFAAFGGWPTAAALTLCGMIGFIAGISGGGDIAQSYYWGETASVDSAPDALLDFIDTSLAEG